MPITVDDREITQHPDIPQKLTTPVIVQRMDAADFAFLDRANDPVGIERCEIGNLIQKMRDGELESQLIRCDENFSSVFLLVEGVFDFMPGDGVLSHFKKTREGNGYYRSRIEPFTKLVEVYSLLVRLSELGIEVVTTANFDCSMLMVDTIYKQRTKPEDAHTMFRKVRKVAIPSKLSTKPEVPMLLALCPRMPDKVAIRLLMQFETIWGVLNATPAELTQVEGMGKGLVDRLLKGVGKVV